MRPTWGAENVSANHRSNTWQPINQSDRVDFPCPSDSERFPVWFAEFWWFSVFSTSDVGHISDNYLWVLFGSALSWRTRRTVGYICGENFSRKPLRSTRGGWWSERLAAVNCGLPKGWPIVEQNFSQKSTEFHFYGGSLIRRFRQVIAFVFQNLCSDG